MLSRLTAAIAERARNRWASHVSDELLASSEETFSKLGPCRPSDRIELNYGDGRQMQISRLAMGTGSDGWMGASSQTRGLGIKGLSDLLVYGFREHGINCWDTADQYGSHPHVAAALKQVDRKDIVLLSKSVATTASQMRRDLNRFRKELGTDYIDILLLHCMTERDWPRRMNGVMEVISEACDEGIVRMRGVSCHSLSALKAAVAEPWVEFDLARINPGGKNMDAAPDKVVPVLRDMKMSGKAVMAMKVLGKGELADDIPGCLRFALGLDCVDCMTIGFLSRDELDELAAIMRQITA